MMLRLPSTRWRHHELSGHPHRRDDGRIDAATPGPDARWASAGSSAAAARVPRGSTWRVGPSRRPAPLTLTVLPFGNIGADSTLSYVAEGLADEVARALARVPGIQIKSRSGARAYRGRLGPGCRRGGGPKLKAEYVLTGIMRQDRGSWILSAELARAADAVSIWVDNFHLSAGSAGGGRGGRSPTAWSRAMRTRFPEGDRGRARPRLSPAHDES